jgi:hypothetical protein
MLATKVPAGKAVEAEMRICIAELDARPIVFARRSGEIFAPSPSHCSAS